MDIIFGKDKGPDVTAEAVLEASDVQEVSCVVQTVTENTVVGTAVRIDCDGIGPSAF